MLGEEVMDYYMETNRRADRQKDGVVDYSSPGEAVVQVSDAHRICEHKTSILKTHTNYNCSTIVNIS